jgi:glycosyltransferase involved in cell wall biosynthesis
MLEASIVVATYNRENLLGKVLEAMLDQDYPKYEVIVVDDGSTDGTSEVAKKYPVKFFSQPHRGPAAARNLGIKNAAYPVIVVMDDDCLPEKNWLPELMKGFGNENIGIVSSFSYYGGTSTAYLKKAVEEAGYFDENFPLEYREDTDLVFRILDMGYEVKLAPRAKFTHLHKKPAGITEKIRYALRRIWVHHVDPLLYKKHPTRTREFLDIKLGFIRNPVKDFQVAVGTWGSDKKMKLSSPQGVVLLENTTPIHTIVILLGGVLYVLSVKLVRLYGSIKYRKLLI